MAAIKDAGGKMVDSSGGGAARGAAATGGTGHSRRGGNRIDIGLQEEGLA
jgi:hypothetical protein